MPDGTLGEADLFKASPPVTCVLPSAKVADVLRKSHQAWLDTPGRGGKAHQDNPVRSLRSVYTFPVPGCPDGWLDDWEEGWGLIVEEAEEAGDKSGA